MRFTYLKIADCRRRKKSLYQDKLTLNEISKFSPPQTSIPGSYAPISKKYSLSAANKPPAIVGDLYIERKSLKLFIDTNEMLRFSSDIKTGISNKHLFHVLT